MKIRKETGNMAKKEINSGFSFGLTSGVITMTGIDPISLAVLTKAIDFLFDEAGKIYHEHRMSKKQANPTRESTAQCERI